MWSPLSNQVTSHRRRKLLKSMHFKACLLGMALTIPNVLANPQRNPQPLVANPELLADDEAVQGQPHSLAGCFD